jgi:hypothetical protein
MPPKKRTQFKPLDPSKLGFNYVVNHAPPATREEAKLEDREERREIIRLHGHQQQAAKLAHCPKCRGRFEVLSMAIFNQRTDKFKQELKLDPNLTCPNYECGEEYRRSINTQMRGVLRQRQSEDTPELKALYEDLRRKQCEIQDSQTRWNQLTRVG